MLYSTKYVKDKKEGCFVAVHRHEKDKDEFTDAELLVGLYKEDMKALQEQGIDTKDYSFKEWMTHRYLNNISDNLDEIRCEMELSNLDEEEMEEESMTCPDCEKPWDECECEVDGTEMCPNCKNPEIDCTCGEEEEN